MIPVSAHFDSVDVVLDQFKADLPWNPFLGHAKSSKFVWAVEGDLARLLPSPSSEFWSPFLYRGQVARHSPCVPGIFRGLPKVDHPQKLLCRDRARCFLARVQLEEYLVALEQHPGCNFSQEIGLVISPEALAQHYELPTDRLDFSEDPDVAAFFAVNERDGEGQWHAVRNGTGVIYRLDKSRSKREMHPSGRSDLECVGKQTLPRPGEQKAWTFRLPLGRDLEEFPVKIFTFKHRESASRRLNEKFERGRLLFPPDPLSEVANGIKTSLSIARCLVSKVLVNQGCPSDIQQRELQASVQYFAREFGIAVIDRDPITLSPAQLAAAQSRVDHLKRAFFDDVGMVAVRSAN